MRLKIGLRVDAMAHTNDFGWVNLKFNNVWPRFFIGHFKCCNDKWRWWCLSSTLIVKICGVFASHSFYCLISLYYLRILNWL